MEKQERRGRKILTENRLATVNKRECSFDGLVEQFENGEDGVYSLINEDKNTIFSPKISITQQDLDVIPFLRQLRDSITVWENILKTSTGRNAYIAKKALIESRKEQYVIKQAYQKPIIPNKLTKVNRSYPQLEDTSFLQKTENGAVVAVRGISLMDPRVISIILCNYSRFKEESWGDFTRDIWYLLQVFDDISYRALEKYPIYIRIMELKIDKTQNEEIQKILAAEFDTTYSMEYISNLWRHKIPKMIAEMAQEDFLTWQYKKLDYPMKTCSKCGQTKPAHKQFFSKNKTSKDGWYSICKRCRNKKG